MSVHVTSSAVNPVQYGSNVQAPNQWWNSAPSLAGITAPTPLSIGASQFTPTTPAGAIPQVSNTLALADGTLSGALWYIPAGTWSNFRIYTSVAGNYTGDNENRLGIYTISGNTLTLAASTANNANVWKATADTATAEALSSPYVLGSGAWHFITTLYNQSAQTTAPTIVGASTGPSGQTFYRWQKITGSQVVTSLSTLLSCAFQLTGQNTLPASIDLSAQTVAVLSPSAAVVTPQLY